MKLMRSLAVPALAGLIGLCWASAANAYSFRVYNQAQTNVVFIHLHTVSAFCHDVSWSGNLRPGTNVGLKSASICLVDTIAVRFSNGQYCERSYPGLTGYSWGVSNDLCIYEIHPR